MARVGQAGWMMDTCKIKEQEEKHYQSKHAPNPVYPIQDLPHAAGYC